MVTSSVIQSPTSSSWNSTRRGDTENHVSGSVPSIHSSASAATDSGFGSTAPVAAYHSVNGRVITVMSRFRYRFVPAGSGRIAFAERHAREWGATVALKGAVTIVTDGKKTFVHDLPNPTLGVGGSGDVLGGAVAAFLARGLAPLAAACAAVWIHGRAGALLASEIGESGALASDIVDALPRAMREILRAS